MSIGELLLAPVNGESPESHAARMERTKKVFSDALDHAAGHKLLQLLVETSHPMTPRFKAGRSNEAAAFIDGQKDLISFLVLNGTSKPIL